MTKNKNTKKSQSDRHSWFGLTDEEYESFMNPSAPTPANYPIIGQDSQANQMPTYSTEHQSMTITQSDLDQFEKCPKPETLYAKFTTGKPMPKFTKLFYLAKGTTDTTDTKAQEPDIGVDIGYVPVGQTQDDENCVRALNYFFRSAELSIFRQPYLPDLSLKIADIHGSNLKPEYRVLVLAFAGYVKLNVRISGDDDETRKKLTLNDREKWYDKRNVNNATLNQIFFDNTSGSGRKYEILGVNGAGRTIMEHLRNDRNIYGDICWFVESLNLVGDPNVNRWDCLTSFFGCWRDTYGRREPHPNNNPDNDWMFQLINKIYKNECLVTIKAIGIVASRIASVLICDDEECQEDDGLFIIKCVSLILDLFAKGNVNGLSESIVPMLLNSVELHENPRINIGTSNLVNFTTAICETIRTISNLSRFDFEWVVRSKYVQQTWYSFFTGALLSLLYNIETLERNLSALFTYVETTGNSRYLNEEYERYNNLLTIIYLKFHKLVAPSTASDRAQELSEFNQWAIRTDQNAFHWTLDDLNDNMQTAHAWYVDFKAKQEQQRHQANVCMHDPQGDGNDRRTSMSPSASRSVTKTASLPPRCKDNDNNNNDNDNNDNDNDNNNNDSRGLRTVSHEVEINNNSNRDINENSNDNNNNNNNNNSNASNSELNYDIQDESTVGSNDANNNSRHSIEVDTNDANDNINNTTNSNNTTMEIDTSDSNNNINDTSVVIKDTNVINYDQKEQEQNEIHKPTTLNLPQLSLRTGPPSGNKVRTIKRNHNHRNSNSFDNSPTNSPKSQSNSVDKARRSVKNNNSNDSSKTKKKKRNSNISSNSNSTSINVSNNDIDEYEKQLNDDDRDESPLDGIEYKETIHANGETPVFNCSTKYVEITDIRCYVRPPTPYTNHPITGIDMPYNGQTGKYDFCTAYTTKSILLADSTWGEVGDGSQRVCLRGTQQSQRKEVNIKVPSDCEMNDYGECLWELLTPRAPGKKVLNRHFSLLKSPRMFVSLYFCLKIRLHRLSWCMFVLCCVIAVLWIQHKLNTVYVPWKPNQVVHIERRGREWKGHLPFDIYDDSCYFVTRDIYTDDDNGWWKLGGWIDLNRDKLTGEEPYAILVEATTCDCRLIVDASAELIETLAAPKFHRPSATARYLKVRAKEGDTRVDVDYCDQWLDDYYRSKKNGTTVAQERGRKKRNDKSNESSEKEKQTGKEKEKDKEKDKDKEKSPSKENRQRNSSKDEIS